MTRSGFLALAALLLIGAPSALQAQAPATNTPTLRATILGSGSPHYDEARAGPAVLIQFGDIDILVDTGNGVQARLDEAGVPIAALDGVYFTHHHLDHNEEFIPIFIRALLGGNPFELRGPAPLAQMAATTEEMYREDIDYRLSRRGRQRGDGARAYTVTELAGGETFTLGGVTVAAAPVNHTIETLAYRFDANGQSIVISGDLTYSPSLSELARGADWLIIDSGGVIKVGQAGPSQSGQRGGGRERAHVTLEETARMASEAGVRGIVLTHFTPGEIDEAATIAALRQGYAGEILFGHDHFVLPAAP